MSSSDIAIINLLNTINVSLYQYGAISLFIIGNLGNCFCILVLSKKAWRKNVCVFYFLVCLTVNLFFINTSILVSILQSGFNITAENSSDALCKFVFYVSYLCSTYYPNILIFASIDRLLISSQNIDTRLYSSKRLAYFSVVTSLVLWSVFLIHVLIKAGVQEVYPTVYICLYELSSFYMDFFSYSSLAITVCIPLIMTVLSVLAFKNVRRLRLVPRQQRKQARAMTKKDFQLLRCLYAHGIIYILFSICIGAALAYSRILQSRTETLLEQNIDVFFNSVGGFLHFVPYCSSFFIFFIMSRAFRHETKRCIFQLMGKDLTIAQEENLQTNGTVVKQNSEAPNIVVDVITPLD